MPQSTNEARNLEIKSTYELAKEAIPDIVIEKWQKIIDLLADTVGSKTGRINRFLPEYYETLISSSNPENPEKAGNQYSLVNGELKWYCKHVHDTKEPLHIEDSDNDLAILGYESADRQLVNIKTYLGYPIELPDGSVFGTICVEDTQTTEYKHMPEETIMKYKSIIEEDIQYLLQQFGQMLELKAGHEFLAMVNRQLKGKLTDFQEKFTSAIQDKVELQFIITDQTKQLEKLNQIIEESAFTNSHKLRGPLASILGIIRILDLEPDMSADALHHLKRASVELDKVVHEIQEILSKAD